MTPPGNGTQEWRDETIRVDGIELVVIKGGTGKPLLVLHEELGWPGWLNWNKALAHDRTLLIPYIQVTTAPSVPNGSPTSVTWRASTRAI